VIETLYHFDQELKGRFLDERIGVADEAEHAGFFDLGHVVAHLLLAQVDVVNYEFVYTFFHCGEQSVVQLRVLPQKLQQTVGGVEYFGGDKG